MKFDSFIEIFLAMFSFVLLFPELQCVLLAVGSNLYFEKIFLPIGNCPFGISFKRLLGAWQWAEIRRSWETVSGVFKGRKETLGSFIKGNHIFH